MRRSRYLSAGPRPKCRAELRSNSLCSRYFRHSRCFLAPSPQGAPNARRAAAVPARCRLSRLIEVPGVPEVAGTLKIPARISRHLLEPGAGSAGNASVSPQRRRCTAPGPSPDANIAPCRGRETWNFRPPSMGSHAFASRAPDRGAGQLFRALGPKTTAPQICSFFLHTNPNNSPLDPPAGPAVELSRRSRRRSAGVGCSLRRKPTTSTTP
jgi:hypothetical protein